MLKVQAQDHAQQSPQGGQPQGTSGANTQTAGITQMLQALGGGSR